MKSKMACIALCVVGIPLFGCASEPRRFTGFLDDYSNLKPHETIPDALVFWNPDIAPAQYTAVLVEPVQVHFMNKSDARRVTPEELEAFRRFVTDELTRAISRHAAIATEPGANVLRVRLQIANLQFTRPAGAPRYPWLPPDHVMGSANIETDACDSVSGELVVAYVGPRGTAELYTPTILAGPPDSCEAAKAVIRTRIVDWTDHAARYFVPAPKANQSAVRSSVHVPQTGANHGCQAIN